MPREGSGRATLRTAAIQVWVKPCSMNSSAAGGSSAFLAAPRLLQLGLDVGVFLGPQGAVHAHSNDFASEAPGHLLPLLRGARMGASPHRPQKATREHDDRGYFGIDARLGILGRCEQCEVGLVLAPECVAGRT